MSSKISTKQKKSRRIWGWEIGAVAAFVVASGLVAVSEMKSDMEMRGVSQTFMVDSPVGMSKASFRAGDQAVMARHVASDMASSQVPSDRKIQETQTFDFVTSHEGVRLAYDIAMRSCEPSFCEAASSPLNNDPKYRHASLQLKIDRSKVNGFVNLIEVNSDNLQLSNHSRSSRDMTSQYQDVSARREAQAALRTRLQELVDNYNGRDIEGLLNIEREIARVQGSIESMDAQIRGINSITDRVTVNLSFQNKESVEPVGRTPYFKNALRQAGELFEKSAAKVVTVSASTAPIGIAGIVLFLLLKTFSKIIFGKPKRRDNEEG